VRKLIGSMLIGLALVAALMVFVDTSLAFRSGAQGLAADTPPPEKGLEKPVPPKKRPDPLPGRGRRVSLRGTIADMPTTTVTGTWMIIDEAETTWTITVTERTKIVPPVADPAPGDAVHVLGKEEADVSHALTASHIVVKEQDRQPARPVEFHGEIEALPVPTDPFTGAKAYLGKWVISGYTVTVDSRTMINPEKRTPEIGMRVNVIAFKEADGTLWAKHIALHRREEAESTAEIEGTIQDLPDPPYLGTWIVDGFTVTVTGTTELKGATPAISLTAKVKGEELEDGSILANKVIVKGPDQEEVEFEGTLLVFTTTRPSEWVIETETPTGTKQISVTVTRETYVNTNKGPVEVGARVEVKALRQTDGTLVAVRIKVEDDSDEDMRVEFEGTVVTTDTIPGTWVVETEDSERMTVTVTADTVIVPPTAPLILGASVEVKALEHPDGSLEALHIKVERPEREEVDRATHLVSKSIKPANSPADPSLLEIASAATHAVGDVPYQWRIDVVIR